jgi:peptidoglycan hydrolase-like protein with peptidoglycan-binding domain
MLGRGGATSSPPRARAAVAALLLAATLVPSLSAHASPGDDGAGESTTTSTTTTATTLAETTTTTSTTAPPTTAVAPTTTATTAPAATQPKPQPTTARATAEASAGTATVMATTTAAPSGRCTVRRTLRQGDTGPDVACLERTLLRRGHTLGGPIGQFGPTTVTAVRKFQQRIGIIAAGVAGPATLSALGIWSGPRIDVSCSVGRVVRRFTRGFGARCVEQRLIQLGYDVQGPDRRFDISGAVAIAAYERSQGFMITDRVAGPWTLHRLGIWSGPSLTVACTASRPVLWGTRGPPARCLEQRLVQLGYPLAAPDRTFDSAAVDALRRYQARIGSPADGRAGKFVLASLGIWNQPPRVTCKVARTVRWGTTGPAARCLERKLVAIGFALDGPNRRFDSTSVDAVRAYQRSKGLDADGVAGPFTLFALGIWSGRNPYAPPPVPANSGTGRRIVYSRAMQRIWAVEANGRVVKTHLVSGRLYEPYAGTYSVYSRSMYTYSVADPDVKWRYMVRFAYGPDGGRIGFHEIPTKFGVPLQSESQLGQPLSGGCVRQRTSDAIWTWNWAYLGTKVVVL